MPWGQVRAELDLWSPAAWPSTPSTPSTPGRQLGTHSGSLTRRPADCTCLRAAAVSDRDTHPRGDLLLGDPRALAQLGQPPVARVLQHRRDCNVEGLLAAGGADGVNGQVAVALAHFGSGELCVMVSVREQGRAGRSGLARPHICLLMILMRLTSPSTVLELQGKVRLAVTAGQSLRRPAAKPRISLDVAGPGLVGPAGELGFLAVGEYVGELADERAGRGELGATGSDGVQCVCCSAVSLGGVRIQTATFLRCGRSGPCRGDGVLAQGGRTAAEGAQAAAVVAGAEFGVRLVGAVAAFVPALVQVGQVGVQEPGPRSSPANCCAPIAREAANWPEPPRL
jgi:hypothetical protein